MRRLLLPLTPIYAAAVAAKNAAYDRGWATSSRLTRPVVSVGNLSVGGSGKTPLVIALAKLLSQRGVYVDVLSRGYGRSSQAVERVDPAGSAERFGDEPLLIAQSAQVPVYVGASRYAAGLLAERDHSGAGAHLLDDGFQHRRLARNADIVVVHRTDLSETLLPAGRLREPISALHRASVLVLRDEDRDLEAPLRQRGIEQQIWWIQRSIILPATMGSAVAFCGIARPEEFFQSLRRNGVEAVAEVAFADHHRYTEFDMDALIRRAQTEKAETFLTTEKDFVRLLPAQREKLATVAPLRVVELQAVLLDEAEVLRYFETLLPSIFPQSM